MGRGGGRGGTYSFFVTRSTAFARASDVSDAARDANSPPRDRSIGGCIVTDGVPRRSRRARDDGDVAHGRGYDARDYARCVRGECDAI